jgi:hypothetical protein
MQSHGISERLQVLELTYQLIKVELSAGGVEQTM